VRYAYNGCMATVPYYGTPSCHKACAKYFITLTLPSTLTLTLALTHKACAKYFILISVVGHVTAHYVNYAKVAPCLL